MDVYLNGQIIRPDLAHIHIDDAGFTHAVGLFETMLAQNGRVFRLDAHLHRLAHSASQLGMSRELALEPLRQAVLKTIEHNQISRARLRLTFTPGSVSMLTGESAKPAPTVLVVADEPTVYDPAYFERGITVLIAPPGSNPFDATAGHKTLAYWSRLRTLRQAASAGAGEAIWLNVSNHLASGAVSNLFLVRNGVLYTPFARGEEVDKALAAPVLPGITRAAVIELAEDQNITVQRKMLTVENLLDADEVFLTNSGWQVLPVTRVEKKSIADGCVGPLTQNLRNALLELIECETEGPRSETSHG